MEYDRKSVKSLAQEIVGFIFECKNRIDKIENIVKELEK